MTDARAQRKATYRRVMRNLWRSRYAYLMLLPVMAYFIIIKYWPMLWIRMSLYEFKLLRGFEGSDFVGLLYFQKFFESNDFWLLVSNTVILNLYSLAIVFPVPILFALLLNELYRPKFKKVVQTISYLPYFISTMVLVSMINTFLSPSLGIINMVMKRMGMETVYFMGKARYFRSIYIISSIWQGMGWSSIVYLCSLTSIDPSLYEAAVVDGAGRLRQTWHVTLPGIRGTIVIMLILQMGRMMSVGFEKVYLLQNEMNLQVSEVISTFLYKKGIVQSNYSYSTAIGLFNSLINFSLILISNSISRKLSEVSLW